jgi:hypothetical protein
MADKHVRFLDEDNTVFSPPPLTPASPCSPASSDGLVTPPSLPHEMSLPFIRTQIHPLLAFWPSGNMSEPPLIWIITLHPLKAIDTLTRSRLIQYSPIRFEPATYPPQPHLALQCDGLPWRVHITASNIHTGVTIGDLLEGFYAHLRTSVPQKQFLSLSLNERKRVSIKFENRYRRHPDRHIEKLKGLKMVDLVRGVKWLGLSVTKPGPDVFTVNLE